MVFEPEPGGASVLPSKSSVARIQTFHIEVVRRRGEDATGGDLVKAAHQLGTTGVTACQVIRLFFLQGELTLEDVERLGHELLADPVTETFYARTAAPGGPGCSGDGASSGLEYAQNADRTVEVTLLPGVTDPAAENLVRAAHLLGFTALERVATGQRYLVWGTLGESELERLAVGVFSNPVIQRFAIDQPITPPFIPFQVADETIEIIPLRTADDAALLEISATRRLALDLAEMQAIRAYFQQEGRDPMDAELETLRPQDIPGRHQLHRPGAGRCVGCAAHHPDDQWPAAHHYPGGDRAAGQAVGPLGLCGQRRRHRLR
jgi:phosphoribosylformylglycinamidine synthase